jgi:hypothetical protein
MTLVEIMVASAVSVLVVGFAMWLVVEGTATAMKTSNVSGNDLTHWGLSNRLVLDSRVATELVVYSDFSKSTIVAEGEKGIRSYDPPRSVGNFLVLALRLPDKISGLWCCSKLTGYVFDPATQVLSKFEYNVEEKSEDDYKNGLSVQKLIEKHHSSFKLVTVSSNVAIPAPASAETITGAFYWPGLSSGNASSTAIMRLNLGDAKQHARVRDTRLVEVAFYIRS